MSILLPRSQTLIVLPPKTGSTWLRAALMSANVEMREVGPPEFGGQDDLSSHDLSQVTTCSIVRSPLAWYRSYWAYRMEGGWRYSYDLDRLCGSERFDAFIRNVARYLPGFLTSMFERFVGPVHNQVGHVLRQERLATDLVALLQLQGEKFDADALLDTPRLNATSIKPDVDDATHDLVTFLELPFIRRFNYRSEVLPRSDACVLADAYPDDTDFIRDLLLWTERTHWEFDDEKIATQRAYNPLVRYTRIYCNYSLFLLYEKHKVSEAEQYFRRALEFSPLHPRTLAHYAVLLKDHHNDAQGAEELLIRALTNRPDHRYARAVLARLMRTLGRIEQADEHDHLLRSRGCDTARILGDISDVEMED